MQEMVENHVQKNCCGERSAKGIAVHITNHIHNFIYDGVVVGYNLYAIK
jgi:hypothetical protein